jgi:TRAP-type C4-dicarboxylate transport system substrate-binding protein
MVAAATPSFGAEVTLRLHHFTPPVAAMQQKFLLPWTKRVAEQSNGELKIDIYPSMQLGGRPPQLIDQFRDGVVDMGWTLPGYTAGRFPKVEVFELPFVHKTTYATNMALVDFQDMHLRDEFKDYKILLLHVHAGAVVIMRDKPIRRLEDFNGLKIRTPNEPGSWFLESVGATPIGTPITEVTQLLSRGVIDGALVPFEIVWPFKMHEMTKYSIDIPGPDRMITSLFFFGMNKKRYEQLPANLRKVIDDTTGRTLAPIAAEVWDEAEEPGIKAAKERGNIFIDLSPAETERARKASESAIQKWLAQVKTKGIDGEKLLADARALIGKYSK